MDMKFFKEMKKVIENNTKLENVGSYAEEDQYNKFNFENIAEWIDKNFKPKNSKDE